MESFPLITVSPTPVNTIFRQLVLAVFLTLPVASSLLVLSESLCWFYTHEVNFFFYTIVNKLIGDVNSLYLASNFLLWVEGEEVGKTR